MEEHCDLFVLYKQYTSGGKIWLMLGLDTAGSDYEDILAIANCLAETGHEVRILHAVHYKDTLYREVFGELIGTRYYRKCPDLLVDGCFVEYESFRSEQPKTHFETCCITVSPNQTGLSFAIVIFQTDICSSKSTVKYRMVFP